MVDIEGEMLNRDLPEDLVEKIVAMMPFPSNFKAGTLSKSWQARFSLAESDDDGVKRLVARFQKLVGETSNKWEIFPAWIVKEEVFVYARASQSWLTPLSLSFLPKNLLTHSYVQIEGALLFLYPQRLFSNTDPLFVANVLTKRWKFLPLCPSTNPRIVCCAKMVWYEASQTYKVILLCEYSRGYNMSGVVAEIYDSKTNAWRCSKHILSSNFLVITPSVYLNGFLYMVIDWTNILAFNIKDETLQEYHVMEELRFVAKPTMDLVVCNNSLVLVLTRGGSLDEPELTYQVLKVELQAQRVVELARGPPPPLHAGLFRTTPFVHGDCIVFGMEKEGTRVLTYNVKEDVWSCLLFPASGSPSSESSWNAYRRDDWKAFSLQPGLNPFVTI